MEGLFEGTNTLFIGSPDITFDKIKEEVNKDDKIKQLYFGAGETTKINTDVLRLCVDYFKYTYITAEINLDDLHTYNLIFFKDVHIIVSITHNNIYLLETLKKSGAQIKLQTLLPQKNRFLTMARYSFFRETDMTKYLKKVYVADEVIE